MTFQNQSHQTVGNNKKSYRRKTIEAPSSNPLHSLHSWRIFPQQVVDLPCNWVERQTKRELCMPARFGSHWGSSIGEWGKGKESCCEVQRVPLPLSAWPGFIHSLSQFVNYIDFKHARGFVCIFASQVFFLFYFHGTNGGKKNGNGNVASAIVSTEREYWELRTQRQQAT